MSVRGVAPGVYGPRGSRNKNREHKPIRGGLNRSRKWQLAFTYQAARALSPNPERPVR